MRHRSTISLGLLLAALCTPPASAQQSSAPVPVTAQAADAKTKSTPVQDTSSDQNATGVSNPEEVKPEAAPASATPDQSSQNADQPAQNDDPQPAPGPGNTDEVNPSANKYLPDQPPASLAPPDLDSNKPVQPDPVTPADKAFPVSTAPAPQAAAPPAQQSAPSTPDITPAASPAPADNTAPAPVPQDQAAVTAPQQVLAPADASAVPQQTVPVPDASTSQTATATPDTSAPAAAAQNQQPATPPATPAQTSVPADNSAAPQQTAPADSQTSTPPASTPADSGAPQQTTTAPADSSAQPGAPAATDNTAPASTSAPLADNRAINPSLPEQQVNEPEPFPSSRVDIFGGYSYLRPSGKVGTWSFPSQNTRAYTVSASYFFTHKLGAQAEYFHSEYPLGTTGTSPAPPFVQLGGVTDSFDTVQGGIVYRTFVGESVIPFVHLTGGGAKIAGPKFQPAKWGYGFDYGAGLDVLLPHTHEHMAFRLVQADFGYMHADQGALQQYDLAGGTQAVSAFRLSTGLVFRIGAMNPAMSKSIACDASPAEVYAGERVTLAATLRNYKDTNKHPFSFSWILTGGKQLGFGPVIFVDTNGLAAGTYHATAHISAKEKGRQFAQCSANFTVKPSPAPTLKCSPDPSTVTPGQVSIITAYAGSIPQRQLTYSYTTSEGQIEGKDNTAQLHTDGLPPGVANVTCRVVDDLGQAAVATTEVTIAPPALPPAPKAQPLCTVYFNRDMRRPARVDNEGRACLDDIALTMEHQPDARLVVVGEHSDSEADGQLTAAERAMNTRAYLANEKGIDPSRVDVRTSTTPGRQVQAWLLAPGAVFDQPTEGRIDESKIKIHGQQYARQKVRPQQKGPVGEGVSHPPKN